VLRNINVPVTGATLSVPAITQPIVDQGLVYVYFSATGTTGPWFSLPYTNGSTTISVVRVSVGSVDVTTNTNQTGLYFKIVVIPGSSVTLLNVTNPGLNFKNYSQVASALHLGN
jgi:hypothetical protein